MKKIIPLFALLLAVAPSTLKAETVHFGFNNDVALNMVKIEIPAPLETTKAQISGIRGDLEIDLKDPLETKGTIEADLSGIQGYSFTDADKNKTQTEHMHNWFQIDNEVKPEVREKNRWAKFEIKKVTKVEPADVQKAPAVTDEIGTGRTFQITADGDFTIHGITKPKTVVLDVTLHDVKPGGTRYQEASRVMLLRTHTPLVISLKEHDIGPRDNAGKFLSSALKVVGLKISDSAQVSLDLRPYQAKTETPKK